MVSVVLLIAVYLSSPNVCYYKITKKEMTYLLYQRRTLHKLGISDLLSRKNPKRLRAPSENSQESARTRLIDQEQNFEETPLFLV